MKKTGRILLLLGVVLLGGILSLNLGYSQIPLGDALRAMLSGGEGAQGFIVTQIRLPRILVACLCGAALALSGCILQSITGNPLADPGILGINAGSGLAVLLLLSAFPSLQAEWMVFQPLFAFAGGMITAVFLYLFAYRGGRLSSYYLLIGGIGASAGLSSAMLILGADMENSVYQAVSRWLAGNLWGVSWHHVRMLLPYLLLLVPSALGRAGHLNALTLGDDMATELGLGLRREQRLLLFIAVGLAAAAISVCGAVSFLGLIAPHIARRLVGARHQALLPASLLLGAALLLLSDTLGRSLLENIEVPAGVVTAILSAPYFLYLLRKQRG